MTSLDFRSARLDNGLQVVAEIDPRMLSMAVGFFVKTGSRDETDPALAGVSHFLEHMVFKGTESRDALEVNRQLDRIGAKHNAMTSEEDTVYYLACLPEYLEPAFDVLSDILRPSLRDEDFDTEKQVILEEIAMYRDNPVMVAYEAAKAAHFGPHPLGQSVLGTPETIGVLQRKQMAAYFDQRYAPSNITLVAAGGVDWDRLVDLAQLRCGSWQGTPSGRDAQRPRGLRAFQTLERADDQQITAIGIADAPAVEDDDRYAAMLLSTIVGDSTNSRLYWELIDSGLADGADLGYQTYNQAGAFLAFLSCRPELAQDNLQRLLEVFRRVGKGGVRADELERARNKVASRAVLRSERPMGRLMSLGHHWVNHQQYIPIAEELDSVSRVQVTDIQRVLDRYSLNDITLVTIGPLTDLKRPDGA